jgi:hypothetical protein
VEVLDPDSTWVLTFALFCLIYYILQSEAIEDTCSWVPFYVFSEPADSVFVIVGTTRVLVFISMVTSVIYALSGEPV